MKLISLILSFVLFTNSVFSDYSCLTDEERILFKMALSNSKYYHDLYFEHDIVELLKAEKMREEVVDGVLVEYYHFHVNLIINNTEFYRVWPMQIHSHAIKEESRWVNNSLYFLGGVAVGFFLRNLGNLIKK